MYSFLLSNCIVKKTTTLKKLDFSHPVQQCKITSHIIWSMAINVDISHGISETVVGENSSFRDRPLMIWGGGDSRKNRKWIYLFNRNAFWKKLFFPGEGPLKFFFLDFLRPHSQIINGRPLNFVFSDFILFYIKVNRLRWSILCVDGKWVLIRQCLVK